MYRVVETLTDLARLAGVEFLFNWAALFNLWQRGLTLPPVDLIRVGEFYSVRDGHHRVSVARALGQAFIEATVTEWK